MKKPVRVTIKNYFPPRGMTPDYLAELATIGRGIAEDVEVPATVRRDCLRVAMASEDCTRLLQADPLALLDAGFRLGRALETVSRNQAVGDALARMQQGYADRAKGAEASHKEDKECRASVEAYYLAHLDKWGGNISAAARDVVDARLVPHKYRTIHNWLTACKKQRLTVC
jgi:hypothetical protein